MHLVPQDENLYMIFINNQFGEHTEKVKQVSDFFAGLTSLSPEVQDKAQQIRVKFDNLQKAIENQSNLKAINDVAELRITLDEFNELTNYEYASKDGLKTAFEICNGAELVSNRVDEAIITEDYNSLIKQINDLEVDKDDFEQGLEKTLYKTSNIYRIDFNSTQKSLDSLNAHLNAKKDNYAFFINKEKEFRNAARKFDEEISREFQSGIRAEEKSQAMIKEAYRIDAEDLPDLEEKSLMEIDLIKEYNAALARCQKLQEEYDLTEERIRKDQEYDETERRNYQQTIDTEKDRNSSNYLLAKDALEMIDRRALKYQRELNEVEKRLLLEKKNLEVCSDSIDLFQKRHDMLCKNEFKGMSYQEHYEILYKRSIDLRKQAEKNMDYVFSEEEDKKIKKMQFLRDRLNERADIFKAEAQRFSKNIDDYDKIHDDLSRNRDVYNQYREDYQNICTRQQKLVKKCRDLIASDPRMENCRNQMQLFHASIYKGTESNHKNSEEFTAMADALNNLTENICDRNCNPREIANEIRQLKAAADHYLNEKKKYWVPGFLASNMRHVRLNFAQNLSDFCNKASERIENYAENRETLQNFVNVTPENFKSFSSLVEERQKFKQANFLERLKRTNNIAENNFKVAGEKIDDMWRKIGVDPASIKNKKSAVNKEEKHEEKRKGNAEVQNALIP